MVFLKTISPCPCFNRYRSVNEKKINARHVKCCYGNVKMKRMTKSEFCFVGSFFVFILCLYCGFILCVCIACLYCVFILCVCIVCLYCVFILCVSIVCLYCVLLCVSIVCLYLCLYCVFVLYVYVVCLYCVFIVSLD